MDRISDSLMPSNLLDQSFESVNFDFGFDQSLFIPQRSNNAESDMEKNLEFLQDVNDSIRRVRNHNLDITKFRVNLSCYKGETATIYQSVREVLGLCRNIRVLELCGCFLEQCLPEEGVNLPCLNKLSLQLVVLDEFTLEKMLGGCPEVSDFSYDNCAGLKRSLSISGLTKLKNLKVVLESNFVRNDVSVAINAPSLESLHVDSGYRGEVKLVIGQNLKSLALECGDAFNDEFLEGILSKSPDLESLSLHCLQHLCKLNLASHHLKNLKIDLCWNLKDCKINAPNLQTFSYKGCSPHDIRVVSTVPCWWRIELDLLKDLHRLSDLKQILQGKKIKYLTISIYKGVVKTKKVSGISPCCEVEQLNLSVSNSGSGGYEKIILGLVSMCLPKVLNVECDVKNLSFLIKGVGTILKRNEKLEKWNIERAKHKTIWDKIADLKMK